MGIWNGGKLPAFGDDRNAAINASFTIALTLDLRSAARFLASIINSSFKTNVVRIRVQHKCTPAEFKKKSRPAKKLRCVGRFKISLHVYPKIILVFHERAANFPLSMPQLTIYLDPATQRQVELAARREAISLSRWARKHLAMAAAAETASAWDHLAGFSGTVDSSFEAPSRDTAQRPVPDLEP